MKMMRYIKILLVCFTFLGAVPAWAVSSPEASALLSQKLTSFRTYVATFEQLTYDGHGRALQRGQGRVMIMRPGLFRWEANMPTHQILITNGQTLWIYDVDLAQATQQPLNQKVNVNPAVLLSGSIENLQKQFNITEQSSAGTQTFILRPKQADMSFKSMQLTFAGGELQQMTVLNNLDETSEYQFKQIRINAPLPSHLFQFKAPPGVDIVNE